MFDWQQFIINNGTIVFTIVTSACGIVWRLGVKLKRTAAQVIEDNSSLKTGMVELKTVVDGHGVQLKKMEIEIQAASDNRSSLKTIQDLFHSLKGEVGALSLKVERIMFEAKE